MPISCLGIIGDQLVRSSRHLIRHEAETSPVVLSAVASKPDGLLTHHTK
jgi:hypothetical protein